MLIEADLIDCMVALPGQLFYSTPIPACLWFLARNRRGGALPHRTGEILFIDARRIGRMVDRTHREFTDDDINRMASTYHAWRGNSDAGDYEDVSGFCTSASLEDIRRHRHALTPGRYVAAQTRGINTEPFEENVKRLITKIGEQQAESARLDSIIAKNMRRLGYDK